MKHQYFGDINDYRKYGLLRILQRASGLRLGVCWMLTPNDARADGKFISYLSDASRWRWRDPDLFDNLATAVCAERRLGHVVELDLLPGAVFFEGTIPDTLAGRVRTTAASAKLLGDCDLIFFDPDNGMEIPSCKAGQKGSSKYLLWAEVADQYSTGKSVLVYQHFPREKRHTFIERISERFHELTGCITVVCFSAKRVAFFLLVQPGHLEPLLQATGDIANAWAGDIRVMIDPQVPSEVEPQRQPLSHIARSRGLIVG